MEESKELTPEEKQAMTRDRKRQANNIWREKNRDRYNATQKICAQKYYYKHREEVLARKQKKYIEDHGAEIVEAKPPEPEPIAEPIPEPEPEPPKWTHPIFQKRSIA